MMDIVLRKAEGKDKDFVIKSIIEATKSGFDILSYATIFRMTEEEVLKLLADILDEDMEGQELCLGSYLIAEINGENVAAIGGWIEMESGMASHYITSNLLMHYMDRNLLMQAEPALRLVKETFIQREPGALQLEIAYLDNEALLEMQRKDTFTLEEFRKLDLVGKLIAEHIKLAKERNPNINRVQALFFQNNARSIRAYQKAGFAITKEAKCSNPAILEILPCDTKIMMEKELN